MSVSELFMRFDSHAAMAKEFQGNLRSGRAFIMGKVEAEVLSDTTLVLVHPVSHEELRLPARVVMVSATPPLLGAGIELQKFGPEVAQSIEAFIGSAEAAAAPVAAPEPEPEAEALPDAELLDAPAEEVMEELDAEPLALDPEEPALEDAVEEPSADDAAEGVAEDGEEEILDVGEDEVTEYDPNQPRTSKRPSKAPSERAPANALERVRRLTVPEQMKLARNGEQADRIALERIVGKPVWENLLHNPRITIPEVARIARMGTAPRPLIEFIVANNAWVAAPPIRRALLTNPKLTEEGAIKILRLMPKQELKLVTKQVSYSTMVRAAAKKLTGQG